MSKRISIPVDLLDKGLTVDEAVEVIRGRKRLRALDARLTKAQHRLTTIKAEKIMIEDRLQELLS